MPTGMSSGALPGAPPQKSLSDILREAGAMPGMAPNPMIATDGLGVPAYAINIEQRWVGSVVGRKGESMIEIEKQSGAIVKLDHSSKIHGFSVCRIYGQPRAADKAADMIRVKLAACADETGYAGPLPEGIIAEDFPVDHGLVGLIMGRGGENLRQIRHESGAEVSFDKKAEKEGNDRFRILGSREQVDAARRLMRAKLGASMVVQASTGLALTNGEDLMQIELAVEQQYVGRIIGKDRETVREMADKSGARIEIEQGTQDQGFSTLRVTGTKQATEKAKELIVKRVRSGTHTPAWAVGDWKCPKCGEKQFARNKDCRRCGQSRTPEAEVCDNVEVVGEQRNYLRRASDDSIPVDQKYVGFLIGPGGQTLRTIKDTSGAKLMLDQDTREKGYSILRIGDSGSPENHRAKEMIDDKIQECMSLPHNRPKVAKAAPQQQHLAITQPGMPCPPGPPDAFHQPFAPGWAPQEQHEWNAQAAMEQAALKAEMELQAQMPSGWAPMQQQQWGAGAPLPALL